jgi:hypothetical protein
VSARVNAAAVHSVPIESLPEFVRDALVEASLALATVCAELDHCQEPGHPGSKFEPSTDCESAWCEATLAERAVDSAIADAKEQGLWPRAR